jgi:hypothetical protein
VLLVEKRRFIAEVNITPDGIKQNSKENLHRKPVHRYDLVRG